MGNGYVKTSSTDALEMDLPYGATLGRVGGYTSINGILIDNTQLA